MLHPARTVGTLEHQAEHGGTDQDEHHEAGQFGSGGQGLREQLVAHAAAHQSHHQGADSPHGATLGRSGNAQEDGTQHQEDQQQGRDQHEGDTFGQLGQQPHAGHLVEDGNHPGNEHAAAHGHHDFLVGGHAGDGLAFQPGVDVSHVASQENGHQRGQDGQHQQRLVAAAAIRLTVNACLGRQGRDTGGLEDSQGDDIQRVQAHQHETGDKGALVHVTHAAAQLVGHDDQHQRRRDDLRQRAGSGNHAAGQTTVVAVAQHDGQRNQAHGDDGSGHHAGRGCQQGADEHHGQSQTAAHRTEHLADGVEQVFRHAAALENQAHQGEEGHGEQSVVLHDAEQAQGQGLHQRGGQHAQFDTDEAKEQAACPQAECDWKADQQEDDQPRKHDRGEVGSNEIHGSGAPLRCSCFLRSCGWPRPVPLRRSFRLP